MGSEFKVTTARRISSKNGNAEGFIRSALLKPQDFDHEAFSAEVLNPIEPALDSNDSLLLAAWRLGIQSSQDLENSPNRSFYNTYSFCFSTDSNFNRSGGDNTVDMTLSWIHSQLSTKTKQMALSRLFPYIIFNFAQSGTALFSIDQQWYLLNESMISGNLIGFQN